MSKDIDKKKISAETAEAEEKSEQQYSLNDDRRVKVLSPGMMVIKRFLRNRIAVVGLCILAFMFVFSFIGGLITPYKENEQFYRKDIQKKTFAGAKLNTEYRYVWAEGVKEDKMLNADFLQALKAYQKAQETGEDNTSGKPGQQHTGDGIITFKEGKVTYTVYEEAEEFYRVASDEGDAFICTKIKVIPSTEGATLGYDLQLAALRAFNTNAGSFELEGETYDVSEGGLVSKGTEEVAFISNCIINPIQPDIYLTRQFREAIEAELKNFKETSEVVEGFATKEFEYKDPRFADINEEENLATPVPQNDDVVVGEETPEPVSEEPEEGTEPAEAPANQGSTDLDPSKSETGTYIIVYKPETDDFEIKQGKPTLVFDDYAFPSWQHLLGTDRHGMDMLTRLMYGGRISLVIGLIVEFIGTFLGMIMGGLAGYFGKWVDQLIMRIVDIFYCIPSTPILIIIGAMMDAMNVDPMLRLLYLMLILGFLNWPGMARLIRGQILSLREQEFMTATEAGGISVSRRIFKHLIPNVVPQIIVSVTMGMGGVIITEASLSFLGLGVKFPFASWGNIINDVNSTYVLQNYWFIWIPAGVLLLLTVLAFNLVGDGLRDAFDPKMKR